MTRIGGPGSSFPIDPADAGAEVEEAITRRAGGDDCPSPRAATTRPPGLSGEALVARTIQPPPKALTDTGRKAEVMGNRQFTELQKHAAYFDLNSDGRITPEETDLGMRKLGLAPISSWPTARVINIGLGSDTSGKAMEVSVENIHKGIHPGDTDVFDAQGRFVPEKFDELWAKHDTNHDGKLTLAELEKMVDTNAAGELKGKIAARGEFFLLRDLAGEYDPALGEKVVTKDILARLYDGSLFFDIAARRAAAAAKNGTDPHKGDVNGGLPGLGRTLGGIFGGAAAGARISGTLTAGEEALRSAAEALGAPLSSAMMAVCPGLTMAGAGGQ